MTQDDALIAVTGSTGRLGGRVARRLADAGLRQRLLVREPARAPQLRGSEVVAAEYADTPEVRRALSGVSVLFMVSASESPDRVAVHRSFLDAAAAAGVPHVVYVSFAGAAPDATFLLARDHWHTEQHLHSLGVPFTVLRDNLYADFLPGLVGPDTDGSTGEGLAADDRGVIRGPAGDGRVAAVAQDDIADAAAAVLRDPAAHAGRTYELTGPQAVSLSEVAELLTAVQGRPVHYQQESVEEAFASRAGYGAPDWMVAGWVSTYTAIAAGELATVTDDVPRLTGHPATTVAEVLRRAAS